MKKGRNVIEIYQNLLSFQNFFSFVDNLRFADEIAFLQFLEAASSGAWGVQQSVWNIPGLPESGCIPVKDGACRRDIREIWRALRTRPWKSGTDSEYPEKRLPCRSPETLRFYIVWRACSRGAQTAAVDTSSFRIKTAMTRLSCLHPALQMINWE